MVEGGLILGDSAQLLCVWHLKDKVFESWHATIHFQVQEDFYVLHIYIFFLHYFYFFNFFKSIFTLYFTLFCIFSSIFTLFLYHIYFFFYFYIIFYIIKCLQFTIKTSNVIIHTHLITYIEISNSNSVLTMDYIIALLARECRRTEGVSTTDLVGRMLLMTRQHQQVSTLTTLKDSPSFLHSALHQFLAIYSQAFDVCVILMMQIYY